METAILGRTDNWSSTAVYGFAHLGKSLFWYSSEILFAYFLTELAGLPASQMGRVLAIGFLVSAGVDLSVGFGLSGRLTDPRTASRLQFVGAVLCSATLVLVFLSAALPSEHRFAFSIVAGVLFRLAFAVYDLPQNALMALATSNPADRLRLASARIWFSGAATLIVAAAVGPMLAAQHRAQGMTFLIGMAGAFAIVAITTAGGLARALGGSAVAPASETPLETAVARAAAGQWRQDFWRLVGVMLATSAFTPVFAKLEPYFAAYVLRSSLWGGVVVILMAMGVFIGQPLWLALCARFTRDRVMMGAAFLQIGALAAFWAFAGPTLFGAMIPAFVFGLGNGGVGMVQWAVFSDVVARQAISRVGPSYGVFTAGAKVGLAGGCLLLSAVLGMASYRGAQSPILTTAMTAIPALGAALVIVLVMSLRTGCPPPNLSLARKAKV